MAKVKKAVTGLLLCFVLVSIGFALGKEATLRRTRSGRAGMEAATAPAAGSEVVVYYMYPTVRCVTCNKIEAAAHKVVHEDFAGALREGRLRWEVVNFHENDALAARYEVATSTVVVARRRGGQDEGFDRLDGVWPRAEKPEELSAYIRNAVAAALEKGGSR